MFTLHLPGDEPDAFAHLPNWLPNPNKDVSVVPLPTAIGAAILEEKCTLLINVYFTVTILDIAVARNRVLDGLSIAFARA